MVGIARPRRGRTPRVWASRPLPYRERPAWLHQTGHRTPSRTPQPDQVAHRHRRAHQPPQHRFGWTRGGVAGRVSHRRLVRSRNLCPPPREDHCTGRPPSMDPRSLTARTYPGTGGPHPPRRLARLEKQNTHLPASRVDSRHCHGWPVSSPRIVHTASAFEDGNLPVRACSASSSQVSPSSAAAASFVERSSSADADGPSA